MQQQYKGSSRSRYSETWQKIALILLICAFLYSSYIMLLDQILLLSLTGVTSSTLLRDKQPCSSSTSKDVPQYFQTTPELWAGPTATGRAPFLVSYELFFGSNYLGMDVEINIRLSLGPNKSSLVCTNGDFRSKFSLGDCSAYRGPGTE